MIRVIASDGARTDFKNADWFNIYQPDGATIVVAYIYDHKPPNQELIAAFTNPIVVEVRANG